MKAFSEIEKWMKNKLKFQKCKVLDEIIEKKTKKCPARRPSGCSPFMAWRPFFLPSAKKCRAGMSSCAAPSTPPVFSSPNTAPAPSWKNAAAARGIIVNPKQIIKESSALTTPHSGFWLGWCMRRCWWSRNRAGFLFSSSLLKKYVSSGRSRSLSA